MVRAPIGDALFLCLESMASGEFTAKQRLFIKAYVSCRNATQAALEAGYSEKTARVIGQENLLKPALAAAIDAEIAALAKSHGVTAEWWAKRMKIEALGEGPDTTPAARVAALKELHEKMIDREAAKQGGGINIYMGGDLKDV